MRAVVLTGFGGPEQLEWHADWPEPTPGAGEVRVRVAACGVNNTDIWTRIGAYGHGDDPAAAAGPRRTALAFPRIQGADAVGVVDLVGAGAPAELAGRSVIVDPVVRERPGELTTARYLGSDRDGGFADYVVVPADNVIEMPTNLSWAEAATLATAGGTAMRMLRHGGFQTGDRVVITGASGGVGTALVQLAAIAGCDVTAVTRRRDLTDALVSLGATTVISADELRTDLAYDGALDVVSGDQVPRLLAALRRGGTYVVSGASGGSSFTMDIRTVYLGHLSLLGTSLFTGEDLRAVVDLAAEGRFVPALEATYPLERLVDAQEHFLHGQRFGNLAIRVG